MTDRREDDRTVRGFRRTRAAAADHADDRSVTEPPTEVDDETRRGVRGADATVAARRGTVGGPTVTPADERIVAPDFARQGTAAPEPGDEPSDSYAPRVAAPDDEPTARPNRESALDAPAHERPAVLSPRQRQERDVADRRRRRRRAAALGAGAIVVLGALAAAVATLL